MPLGPRHCAGPVWGHKCLSRSPGREGVAPPGRWQWWNMRGVLERKASSSWGQLEASGMSQDSDLWKQALQAGRKARAEAALGRTRAICAEQQVGRFDLCQGLKRKGRIWTQQALKFPILKVQTLFCWGLNLPFRNKCGSNAGLYTEDGGEDRRQRPRMQTEWQRPEEERIFKKCPSVGKEFLCTPLHQNPGHY